MFFGLRTLSLLEHSGDWMNCNYVRLGQLTMKETEIVQLRSWLVDK